MRFVAAVILGLTPLLGSAAAGTVPAFAGGGAGMTLTATMEGQDQRLLAGTRHPVAITVADTPGESDLRDVWVGIDDLDPRPLAVTCPAGENGHLSLEPGQSLHCTATVTAEVGYRTLLVKARGRVPGGGDLARSTLLHYTGYLPPPPPAPPATRVAVKSSPVPESASASARPHPVQAPAPVVAPASPPRRPAEAAPAVGGACGGKSASGGCCDSHSSGSGSSSDAGAGCPKTASASADPPHKSDSLAFTGMSASMLATAGALGLALIAGGTLLVRRVTRR